MAAKKIAEEKNNLKLITLYREAVHQPDPDSQNTGRHRQLTLTMDYFDALEVKSFSMADGNIREFFGQDIDEELNDSDIAMHSIPLYRPDNNFTREVAGSDPYYGDPLDENSKNGYLCLLQVYITPEVLRRLDVYKKAPGEGLENVAAIYDSFFRDLHRAMNDYTNRYFQELEKSNTEKRADSSICYCIYQSLSIGDYLIGIRCQKLDYVFHIMESIRRRKFVDINGQENEKNEEPNSLVIYKTYTIVSISDLVIPEETEPTQTQGCGNRFILRAVLSNHYWNDEEKIEKKYLPKDYLHSQEFKRLHGRYNFSVELSEAAFLKLLPTIEKYKLNHKDVKEKLVSLNERETQICNFLKDFLEKGYISQLNERYVASNDSTKEKTKNEKNDINKPFCSLKYEKGYFNGAIKHELEKLKVKIREVHDDVKKLNTSRESISYNMRLLKRLANTCSAINGYSDSRIYAVIIIRLIYAVLDGMIDYLEIYDNTKDYNIIKKMDYELNGAVADLNEFSSYILDNSLQSLQAPDYNLESHTSVEKLMMSYSAFLQNVIDWYANTEFAKSINGLREKYVTIMVPKAVDNGLSIKSYFYRLDDTTSERRDSEKLLAVHCPSFYTLTDFAGSLGRLLHELAHNLRYESREKRNEVIINYSAGLLLNQLGVDMMERFRMEIETLRETVKTQEILEECFTGNFISYLKKNIPNYKDMKLLNLTEAINRCYFDLIKGISYLGALRKHIDKFVRSPEYRILNNDEIKKLWDFYDRFFDERSALQERIGEQAKTRDELVSSLRERLFGENRIVTDNESLVLSEGLFDVLSSGLPDEDVERSFRICLESASFIRELTKSVTDKINEFQDTPDGRKIARYLSMGYYFVSDNSSIDFMEYAQQSLWRTKTDALEFWQTNLYMYREVASDLFMAKVLGLTQFGYLNFCTRYIPADGVLDETFIARMALTIFSMSGSKEALNKGNRSNLWKRVFHSLCRYICNEIRGFSHRTEKEEISAKLMDFADGMEYFATHPVNNELKMLDNVEKWNTTLQSYSCKISDEYVSRSLMHCSFLCRNFWKVCRNYDPYLGKFCWSNKLAEDLAEGGEVLENLHQELKESSLWKYCCIIREAFNEPQAMDGDNYDIFSVQYMNEFVLNMHYDMLFKNIEKFNIYHRQDRNSVLK